MTEQRPDVRWLALIAGTILMLFLCWEMIRPFLQVIVWSALIAILFYPAHRFILARVRRPSAAAALSILFVLLVVIAPIGFVTTAVVREAAQMAQWLQDALARLRADPQSAAALQRILDTVKQYVDVDDVASAEQVAPIVQRVSQFLLAKSAGFVGGVVGVLVSLAFTLFTLFYLFRDGETIGARLPEILPLGRAKSEELLERTRTTITACVYGVLVIAILQGFLGGLMFAILGLPSALLWGVVMTILATIPMAGAAIVWAPAAAILFVAGSYTKAIVLFLWGALAISTIDNFLRPRLVSDRTRLHELFIFFSVLGGLRAFGFVGLLIGPVVLAITLALLEALFAPSAAGAATGTPATATPAAGTPAAGAPSGGTARPAGPSR
jgi:predicted PurR-regulated permease PerM